MKCDRCGHHRMSRPDDGRCVRAVVIDLPPKGDAQPWRADPCGCREFTVSPLASSGSA